MTKETFTAIVNLIMHDAIFQNNSTRKQERVWVQLMVALIRFGSYGNGH